MSDVIDMFRKFKSDREKQDFITAQHKTITQLMEQNQKLELEVEHLKTLLVGQTVPFIISPEEALIESQIKIIQQRSFGQELDLEDVKKLDLLIKNKKIIREESKTIPTTSTLKVNSAELLLLAKSDDKK